MACTCKLHKNTSISSYMPFVWEKSVHERLKYQEKTVRIKVEDPLNYRIKFEYDGKIETSTELLF